MRIIAGRFKGLRLTVPKGKALRPTTERVREALFSTLGPVVEGSRVLDLFAGTGAFGFEALSRGASFAMFVDSDRRIMAKLAESARSLGLVSSIGMLTMSAVKAVKELAVAGDKFRIIYLDPPYSSDWMARVVSAPLLLELLEDDGLLVMERDAHETRTITPEGFNKTVSRKYGDTLIEIFRRADA